MIPKAIWTYVYACPSAGSVWTYVCACLRAGCDLKSIWSYAYAGLSADIHTDVCLCMFECRWRCGRTFLNITAPAEWNLQCGCGLSFVHVDGSCNLSGRAVHILRITFAKH